MASRRVASAVRLRCTRSVRRTRVPSAARAQCGLVRTCSVPDDYMTLYTSGDRYHGGRAGHIPYRDRFEHDWSIAAMRWPRLLSRLRLLDVGCANGAFVRYAAEQGMDAEGLELDMPAWPHGRKSSAAGRSTARGRRSAARST